MLKVVAQRTHHRLFLNDQLSIILGIENRENKSIPIDLDQLVAEISNLRPSTSHQKGSACLEAIQAFLTPYHLPKGSHHILFGDGKHSLVVGCPDSKAHKFIFLDPYPDFNEAFFLTQLLMAINEWRLGSDITECSNPIQSIQYCSHTKAIVLISPLQQNNLCHYLHSISKQNELENRQFSLRLFEQSIVLFYQLLKYDRLFFPDFKMENILVTEYHDGAVKLSLCDLATAVKLSDDSSTFQRLISQGTIQLPETSQLKNMTMSSNFSEYLPSEECKSSYSIEDETLYNALSKASSFIAAANFLWMLAILFPSNDSGSMSSEESFKSIIIQSLSGKLSCTSTAFITFSQHLFARIPEIATLRFPEDESLTVERFIKDCLNQDPEQRHNLGWSCRLMDIITST